MSNPPSILITGGSSGLGRALAEEAGARGYRVAIADIHETRGEELCALLREQEVENMFIACDVRREADLRRAVDRILHRWQQLDVMVNNAGIAGAGLFETIPSSEWDRLLDTNLMGVVRGCRAALRPMKQRGQGHIVNIASMAGLVPPPGMSHYNVAKAGVVSLSESLRAELAPLGLHVTVVCPSFFRTNLSESLRAPDPVTTARFERLLERSDITAEEIAKMTLDAVEKKKFLALPHPEARRAWRMKRWFPERFYRAMEGLGAKLRR